MCVYELCQQLKEPARQVDAEKSIIDLVRRYPQVSQFGIGSTTFLHHLCATQASLLTVKAVYDAYPNAIMADHGDGLPLHVACRKQSPADVVAFLAHAYPLATTQLGAGRSPLSLAIQNHPQRRDLVPILSCPQTIASLGPMRMEWRNDDVFLLDGLRAFAELVKPTRLEIRICRGMTASSLSLENRQGMLSVHAWFLPHRVESVLMEIGKIDVQCTEIFIDYFEGLDEGLVRGIASVPSLESLSMCRCTSDEPTIRSLLRELSNKSNFRHLLMNRMDAITGTSFEYLPSLRRLEYLSLLGTPVDSSIPALLNQLLRTTQTLKGLYLGRTRMDRAGVRHVLQAVQHNTTLTVLGVPGLPGAAERMLEMLEIGNCKLENVVVADDHPDKVAIDYYCALNKSGRSTARRVDTTKREYIHLLAGVITDTKLIFGLLQENPATWAVQP
jgi:hypothetical protein